MVLLTSFASNLRQYGSAQTWPMLHNGLFECGYNSDLSVIKVTTVNTEHMEKNTVFFGCYQNVERGHQTQIEKNKLGKKAELD